MTKNIIQDGETPRRQKLENSNSEEVREREREWANA